EDIVELGATFAFAPAHVVVHGVLGCPDPPLLAPALRPSVVVAPSSVVWRPSRLAEAVILTMPSTCSVLLLAVFISTLTALTFGDFGAQKSLTSQYASRVRDGEGRKQNVYATSSVPLALRPRGDADGRQRPRGDRRERFRVLAPATGGGGSPEDERLLRVRRPGASLEEGTAPRRLSLLAGGGGRRTRETDPPLGELP
ncbi:hypothetical protein THAOC_11775, partial [Thalassiosira oceanica]